MILFTRSQSVRSFRLSIIPCGKDKAVAFGPGAVMSGSVFLSLDKPIPARRIRVVFKCDEHESGRKEPNNVFSVESILWQDTSHPLKEGSHMYMFAIKFPRVNYPSSVHDSFFGQSIEYTLQAFLDTDASMGTVASVAVPVIYLPLVTCPAVNNTQRHQIFQRGDGELEVTAELIKPGHCPGDVCTVKLVSNNRSDHKQPVIQLSLVATATCARQDSQMADKVKRQTMYSETFYQVIPKRVTDHQTICSFTIPPQCKPSMPSSSGQPWDLSYQAIVCLPWSAYTVAWPFNSFATASNPRIALPLTITTLSSANPPPPHFSGPLPFFDHLHPELPFFLPTVESPLISPTSPYSVEDAPGSPLELESPVSVVLDDGVSTTSTMVDHYPTHIHTYAYSSNQDASGHLVVPGATYMDRHRRLSTGASIGSASMLSQGECSIEISSPETSSTHRLTVQ